MVTRADRAETLFREGCNCAQAVFVACLDEQALEKEAAIKIAASFGGGMGRLREVCGALTGLFMAVGLKEGYTDLNDREAKTAHYQLIQNLGLRFKEEYGSLLCRDLLMLDEQVSDPQPEVRTEAYYAKRPCAEYVRFAASLFDQMEADQITKR